MIGKPQTPASYTLPDQAWQHLRKDLSWEGHELRHRLLLISTKAASASQRQQHCPARLPSDGNWVALLRFRGHVPALYVSDPLTEMGRRS